VKAVVLQRESTEESWGLEGKSKDGVFIQSVVTVSPAIEQWNRENPDSPLHAGRAILAVNGHEKSENIMNELRSALFLEMRISSVLTRSQRSSYWGNLQRKKENSMLKKVEVLLEHVEVAGGGQCSICLDDMDEQVVRLNCGHAFHRPCVTKWLVTKSQTCPLCKQQLGEAPSKA